MDIQSTYIKKEPKLKTKRQSPTKKVNEKKDLGYEPTPYLKRVIRQAEKNRKEGKGSPVFNTAEEAIAWLEKQGI